MKRTSALLVALALSGCDPFGSRMRGALYPIPILRLEGPSSAKAGVQYTFKITSLSYSNGNLDPGPAPAAPMVEADNSDGKFTLIVQEFQSGFDHGHGNPVRMEPGPIATSTRYFTFVKPGRWTIRAENDFNDRLMFAPDDRRLMPPVVELVVQVD